MMSMRDRAVHALLFSGAALLSCGGSTDSTPGHAGSGGTGATPTGGQVGSGGTVVIGGTGGAPAGGSGGSLPSAVICNGVSCASNQECCLTSGNCFDPNSDPTACVKPTEPGPQGQAPCGASSQCASGEYCLPSNYELCLGSGYCTSKSNCPSSSPGSFCGCNGVTYPDLQTACNAGVAIIGDAACGDTVTVGAGGARSGKTVTYCATNANCPSGQACCGITGQCYDPAQPVLCSAPPAGTNFPCIDDAQCFGGSEYCYADTCDGPGGCVSIPGSGDCTGELNPVCGCNGQSYVNAKCAAVAGVRVAHAGQCP